MFADGPLLVAQQGQDGAFPHWLEELGLKDFLSSYPLRQLVEWGWLIPQYRIVFSQEFFISWEHFPMSGVGGLPESRSHSLLWESEWFIDTTDEPLWFLHPFFRPGDPIERLLDQQGKAMPGIPEEFPHPNGSRVTPYADYFYHWQGYALVDVIRSADHFPGML